MASVGAVSFDLLYGVIDLAGLKTEQIEAPGVDGFGARTLAILANASQVQGTAWAASAAAARTHLTNCKALEGTVVTVTEMDGTAHANCLVVSVEIRPQGPALLAVRPVIESGVTKYQTTCTITVRAQTAA